MRVELSPGETLEVTFAQSDGNLFVSFDDQVKDAVVVTTDWPDSSGRQGVLYQEDFGVQDDGSESDNTAKDDLAEEIYTFQISHGKKPLAALLQKRSIKDIPEEEHKAIRERMREYEERL